MLSACQIAKLKKELTTLCLRFGFTNVCLVGNHDGLLEICSHAVCNEAADEIKRVRDFVEAALDNAGIPEQKTHNERT